MSAFDPGVIQKFADRLYSQARWLAVEYGFFGLVIGGITGFVGVGHSAGLAIALVGAVIGAAYGNSKAFALKLQAQTALCQLAIEANTRKQGG